MAPETFVHPHDALDFLMVRQDAPTYGTDYPEALDIW
jgi:hypothetical protein